MSEGPPIRVGVVGVGWGALVHVPAYRAVQGFEVAALCARHPESVQAAGARLGIPDVGTDWRSFVARDDLDLISIASPVTQHADVCLAALAAGKHVLCEKPLALDAVEAHDLVQAEQETDRATATCFELRWLPHKLAIWDLVDAGTLGVPYFARVCQSGAYWHPTHAAQSPWMYKRGEGGGYLMGQQSHEIDFVHTLLGESVAVCADVKTSVLQRELRDGSQVDVDADDTGNLLLRLASGASAVLSSSVVGLHTMGQTLEMFGAHGTIVYDGAALRAGTVDDVQLTDRPVPVREPKSGVDLGTRRSAGMVRAMSLLLEEWQPALSGEPAPRVPSWRDGWMVARVIDAARASSEGAGWIDLPLVQ